MHDKHLLPIPAGDLLYEAASVACLAPSIANTQPWRWSVGDGTLDLRADRTRQLTIADPQGRLMILSCGTVLHHASIVLAALGAAATTQRLSDPDDPDLLARLTITGLHQVTAEDMRLHHALRTRRTDRRPFLGLAPLPDEVIALLCNASIPFGVTAHEFDAQQTGMLGLAVQSAAIIENHEAAYREEAATWTRRDPSARDGVPPASAVAQVARTVAVRDFAPAGTPGLAVGPGDDRYTTYLAFSTVHDTPADWLRTGEAVSAVLLTAATLGVATSVMSDVVEIAGARALLHAAIGPDGYPQLTLRAGVNESAPPIPATPRRPAAEVIGKN
jgi:hypothetical protein